MKHAQARGGRFDQAFIRDVSLPARARRGAKVKAKVARKAGKKKPATKKAKKK